MSVTEDFQERLKVLNDRIDEIVSSDRSIRVKLIRVRHARHHMEGIIAEIDVMIDKG